MTSADKTPPTHLEREKSKPKTQQTGLKATLAVMNVPLLGSSLSSLSFVEERICPVYFEDVSILQNSDKKNSALQEEMGVEWEEKRDRRKQRVRQTPVVSNFDTFTCPYCSWPRLSIIGRISHERSCSKRNWHLGNCYDRLTRAKKTYRKREQEILIELFNNDY